MAPIDRHFLWLALVGPAITGCPSEGPCQQLAVWQEQNSACVDNSGFASPPWIPAAESCDAGFSGCGAHDQSALQSYANCLPNCPTSGGIFQLLIWGEKLSVCGSELNVSAACQDTLSGASGGAGGGDGGVCASFSATCQTAVCCSGLTCDPTSGTCLVSLGGSCAGTETQCATPNSCLPSGVCGTASTCGAYGSSGCSPGSCCTGLSCDSTSDSCHVAAGSACAGQVCAAPFACLSSGVCGTAPSCGVYGSSGCTAISCCSGLSCDAPSGLCYVADGVACTGQNCATPDTCLASGVCGPAPACLPQNSACTIGGEACCTGYTCTKSRNTYLCL